jgi:O-antigen/teichoic acid export membrane protein
MSKALMKGAVILTITTFLSKLIGSFFQIPLQNIAGDEVLGIFRLVFPVYMIALTLSVAGIPLAISTLIADLRAKDDKEGIAKLFTTASILGVVCGLIGFVAIFVWSDALAIMLGGPETKIPLLIVSLTLLMAPYMAVYRGYFQGFGLMAPTGVSQVIEQFVRVFVMLAVAYAFVLTNQSNSIIAGGAMIGSCIGVVVSLLYLRQKYVRSEYRYRGIIYTFRDWKKYSKKILRVSIPIAVGALAMPLLNVVDSVTIPYALGGESTLIQEQFGIYSRGSAFTQLIVVFASAVVFPLIPLLTTALAKGEHDVARKTIERTHKLTHILTAPITIWLIALTVPLNIGLFTDTKGSGMLAIIIASSYFTSFTLLFIGILQGMNRQIQAAWLVLGATVLKVIGNIIFVKHFGIEGAAYSTLLISFLLYAVTNICIRRHLSYASGVMQALGSIAVSCVLGFIMYEAMMFLPVTHSRLASLLYSGVAMGIGLLLYVVCAWKCQWIPREIGTKLPFVRNWLK